MFFYQSVHCRIKKYPDKVIDYLKSRFDQFEKKFGSESKSKKKGPDPQRKKNKSLITDLRTKIKYVYTNPDLDPQHVLLSGVTVYTLQVDLNGDGTIDFPEFLEMMKQKSSEADQVIRDQ